MPRLGTLVWAGIRSCLRPVALLVPSLLVTLRQKSDQAVRAYHCGDRFVPQLRSCSMTRAVSSVCADRRCFGEVID